MLVLSRRHGEGILIGDDIMIRVDLRGGNRVRIGIAAPKSVKIMRGEGDGSTSEMTCGRLGALVLKGRWLFRKRVRDQVFYPSYFEFIEDYVEARTECKNWRDRNTLRAIFAWRGLMLYAQCFAAIVPDWLTRRFEK